MSKQIRPQSDKVDTVKHGYGPYSNGKCRCVVCTAANAEYHAAARLRRAAAGELPEGVEHGTVNAYQNYRCRCDACRQSQRDYSRQRSAAAREARVV